MLRNHMTSITRIVLARQWRSNPNSGIGHYIAGKGVRALASNLPNISSPVEDKREETVLALENLLRNFENEFKELHFIWKSRIIGEKNWNETWEKSIGIVEATNRIIIKPSWKKPCS